MALIGDRVPAARRPVVLARYLTATITGMVAGQWASGLFADTVGWRWAFAAFALLFGLVGGWMLAIGRAEWHAVPPAGPPPAFGNSLARVLGEPQAQAVLAVTVVYSALSFGAITFVPAFLHDAFGLSLRGAAGVVVLYGVGGLAFSWGMAGLAQRLGATALLRAGGLLVLGGYLGLVVAPHWAWGLPACFVAGLGYYAVQNLLNLQATVMAPPPLRGTALSLFAAALFVGIALGVSLAALAIAQAGYRGVFAGCGLGVLAVALRYGRALARRTAVAAA